MAIALVQKATGNGATLVLNSVVSGNALFLTDSYFRNPTTGAAEATPTDTNGTFTGADVETPNVQGGFDMGASIFHQQNAASGTHTVTPQANTGHNTTLVEFSGMLTSGMADQTAAAGKSNGAGTSQATGTTGTTAQANELSIIVFAMGDTSTGSSNVGLTDPVANYTTLQVNNNDASDTADMHAYRILSAAGTQSATFNWTFSSATQWWMADIATFKDSGVAVLPALIDPAILI